jgi:CRISPR/Cas system-associated endonuclease Cas1
MARRIRLILLLWLFGSLFAHTKAAMADSVPVQIINGDTVYLAFIREIYVFPKLVFKNKQQERFYWKTVRDVKKTLPYAKMITQDMAYADAELAKLTTDKERRQWWRKFERQLFKKYEKDFRGMYASQGRMLMKLMDRESNKTSYELIRQYRGKAAADFWQFVAKLFKNDLKEGYDGADKDRIVERVITLVEAGQL